jgi:hypothetical protein
MLLVNVCSDSLCLYRQVLRMRTKLGYFTDRKLVAPSTRMLCELYGCTFDQNALRRYVWPECFANVPVKMFLPTALFLESLIALSIRQWQRQGLLLQVNRQVLKLFGTNSNWFVPYLKTMFVWPKIVLELATQKCIHIRGSHNIVSFYLQRYRWSWWSQTKSKVPYITED